MLHILILCLVIFSQSTYTEQLSLSNCSYGTLTHGVAAWGLNMDGKPISGSSTVVHSGSESIEAFNKLWYNFSSFVICVAPFASNGKQQTNYDCDYGLLTRGVATWGVTSQGKNTRLIIAKNGSASIDAFTRIMNDFPTVTQIWFQPLEP